MVYLILTTKMARSKEANRAACKKWREANKDRYRKYQREWRAKNVDHVRKESREYTKESPEKRRESRRKWKYKIDQAAWNTLFDRQGRCCAICKSTTPKHSKLDWATDHDHATGKLRGILCHGCNRGLGAFEDNREALIAAAAYLVNACDAQKAPSQQ